MALLNNWTFKLNQKSVDNATIQDQNRTYLLLLFNFLIENGWIADGSSNGVSVSDTNNIVTKADIVTNTGTSAHSWIILKSKEGFVAGFDGSYLGDQSRVWIVISCETTTVYKQYNSYISLGIHRTKPTGGLITATPTSPQQNVSTERWFGDYALNSQAYFHFAITDKGRFWTAITYPNTGRMTFVMAAFPIKNIPKYCGVDHPFAVAFYAKGDYISTEPLIPSGGAFMGWNFSGYSKTLYSLLLRNGSNASIGSYYSLGQSALGELASHEIGVMDDILNTGLYPRLMGYIADFKFSECTSIPIRTTNFEGNMCSFYQWFFPVNTLIK